MFIKRYWSLLSCYLLAYLTSSSSSFSSSGYSSQIPLNKPLVTQPVDLSTNLHAYNTINWKKRNGGEMCFDFWDHEPKKQSGSRVINSNMVFRKKRAMS